MEDRYPALLENYQNGNRKDVVNELKTWTTPDVLRFCLYLMEYEDASDVIFIANLWEQMED